MTNVGYVLCFAPVLMKMWRVYYIFHNPAPNKKVRYNSLSTVTEPCACGCNKHALNCDTCNRGQQTQKV